MNFRSEFTPKSFAQKINHTDNLFLIGSCFTEQMGAKLAAHKFNVLENPHGILFNPISIAHAMQEYCTNTKYIETDLFYFNELWASKKHHTKFSHPEKAVTLESINKSNQVAHQFIANTDWIFITLGSAFVYEWKDIDANNYENVAANCHKIPTDKFNRRLLNADEVTSVLQKMQVEVLAINSKVKFIYTISPVRHLREGFIENNRSKATLIQAVHNLVNEVNCFYFPAYELIIDDLRDYRFFAEDLVHPNYAATNYVWEKLLPTVMETDTLSLLKEINEINAAINHKPFNPTSQAHELFKTKHLQKVLVLAQKYSHINFEKEIEYFSAK
jgi:hypothetical protein